MLRSGELILRTLAACAIGALGAAGCVGAIGDNGGTGKGAPGGGTEGSHTAALGVDGTRRLSPAEYEVTLRTLFGDEPVDAVLAPLAALPNDRGKNEFSTMEHGITASHVDTYYSVAKAIADVVSFDSDLRRRVHTCLGAAAPDTTCVELAIDAFAPRAFRRPLAPAERDEILASYEAGSSQLSFEDGLALALMTILESPYFLYHLEFGDEADGAHSFDLSDYELASRLSYFLTGGPPDDALRAAVVDRSLRDEAQLEAEIDRLLATPAARLQVRRFFTEWLGLDRIPVPQHSAAFLDGVDPASAATEMRAELEKVVGYYVFDQQDSFATLMRSQLGFPGPNLAMIYGVGAAAGTNVASIADDLRAGLLTRAAFLSTTSETTHPIQRAAFVMRRLLCDDIEIPPPSAGLDIEPPAYDSGKTARERWTAQTSGGNCSACHARINPFGFALEKYDALGRYRELEAIVDPADGSVVNELPIDDAVQIRIDGSEITVTGGVGLSDALASSATVRRCFARKWFRFAHGRRETEDEIDLVAGDDDSGRAMVEVLGSVARQPGFGIHSGEGGQP